MIIGIEAQRIFRPHKHGMDVVAVELIKALQKIDTKNQYYIFVKKDEDSNCIQETENFKIVETPARNYIVWEQIELPKYVKKYKIEILHCTSNTAPLFVKCKLVLTLHDVIFMEKRTVKNTSSLYQKLGNVYRKFLVPKILSNVSQLVSISNQEKENIKNAFGLEDQQVKVIYNGVSERFGATLSQEKLKTVKEKFGLTDDFVLFLGNVEPRKNTPNVLKSFALFSKKNPNLKLVITGLKLDFIKSLLSEIHQEDLINQIILTDFVSNDELLALYQLANMYLFPSLREGFGLPILEAMSYGTPVISSNVSCMPEIAGDAALLIDPQNPEQISAAMENIYTDSDLRAKLNKKGKNRIQYFTWANAAQEYLRTYENLEHLKN